MYSAMDIFVFPSRYEGLGMAAVKAQMCGVKTIISKAIPKDAIISSHTECLSLADGINVWAEKNNSDFVYYKSITYSEGYDISVQSKKLIHFYGGLTDEKIKT